MPDKKKILIITVISASIVLNIALLGYLIHSNIKSNQQVSQPEEKIQLNTSSPIVPLTSQEKIAFKTVLSKINCLSRKLEHLEDKTEIKAVLEEIFNITENTQKHAPHFHYIFEQCLKIAKINEEYLIAIEEYKKNKESEEMKYNVNVQSHRMMDALVSLILSNPLLV